MVRMDKSFMRSMASDLLGGFVAMLITLPTSIAFGLIIYSPLGDEFASQGALMGIFGAIALGIVAPLFGGTPRLVSSPCAPAAAVLAAFTAELLKLPGVGASDIPVYIALTTLIAGMMQLITSFLKGGSFIKYVPYPVISGYLSGVGILIIIGQLPKLLGVPSGIGILEINLWSVKSFIIGMTTVLAMIIVPRFIKKIPAAIISFSAGLAAYWMMASFIPEMCTLKGNMLVIGNLGSSIEASFFSDIINKWADLARIDYSHLRIILFSAGTLAVLLSIDTLKTSVIVDTIAGDRHDSNKELRGQGLANMVSGLVFGMPGAGTMGPTLLNISSGANTKLSGFFAGTLALIAFLAIEPFVSWVPVPVLSGILIVGAARIIDKQSLRLLLQKSTFFDFLVILSVVISAIFVDLIVASGVGIAFAIMLFLRDQVRSPVIARKIYGNQIFSKRKRLDDEMAILYKQGHNTVIYELQGSLFFGTTDQLYSEIEPVIKTCKFIIMDLKRVISIDLTAIHRLEQLARKVSKKDGFLILASLNESDEGKQNIRKYFEEIGFIGSNTRIRVFQEIETALEWVEEEILCSCGQIRESDQSPLDITEISLFSNIKEDFLRLFSLYLKTIIFKNKDIIFKKGDEGNEIFFIRHGTVRIELPLEKGRSHLLAIFGRGDFFGDMCFIGSKQRYRSVLLHEDHKRSANAVAEGDVSLFVLSRKDFDRLAEQHPRLASMFYEELAGALALRLRQTTTELKSLQEA